MENLWVQIGNYGFPMVIAFYLLVRVEKKLDDLTAAIHDLAQTLGRTAPGYGSTGEITCATLLSERC